VFLDEAHSYFPMELIIDAVSAECERWDGPEGACFTTHRHRQKKGLTVIYVIEKLGDVFYTRLIKPLRGVSFEAQKREIELVKESLPLYRLCIDASGLGMQLAEELKKHGHPLWSL
jgi:lipid A disaccharide synthetase